jgi:hypothetical protein
VREREESRHHAVGAGAPSDPDGDEDDADEQSEQASEMDERDGSEEVDGGDSSGAVRPAAVTGRTASDVVQAVADFLEDLVDDPTFADDPHHTRCTRSAEEI